MQNSDLFAWKHSALLYLYQVIAYLSNWGLVPILYALINKKYKSHRQWSQSWKPSLWIRHAHSRSLTRAIRRRVRSKFRSKLDFLTICKSVKIRRKESVIFYEKKLSQGGRFPLISLGVKIRKKRKHVS